MTHPITHARQQHGVAQADLAAQLDVQPAAIEAWEQGSDYPEPRLALRLARRLQLSLAEIYGALARAELAAGFLPAAKPGPKPATPVVATAAAPHPIRVARERRHFSQADLAKRVGAQVPAISKWETGVAFPRPATAFRLASELRIPLEDVYASARDA